MADFGLAGKVRPTLVITISYQDDDRALIGVIPHTTSLCGSEFEVKLAVRGLSEGAFNVQGTTVLAPARFIRRITVLNPSQLAEVELKFKRWFGLS